MLVAASPGGNLRVGLAMAHPHHGPAGPRRYARALGDALRELPQVEVVELSPPAGSKPLRRIWDTFGVSLAAGRRSVDLVHCTGIYAPVISRVPVVLTVHDLAIRHLPDAFPALNQRLGWQVWSRIARRANYFIAVSAATRCDLVAWLGVPRERVAVVHHGVADPFGAVAADEIGRVKRAYALDEGYLLAVGTLEPRKNLQRTLQAFATARASVGSGKLVVVGAFGWGQARIQRQLASGAFGPSVGYLGHVPDADLAPLYAGARGLVYPSLYEGFGLPVLEAMACGCPVVTSARGGLAEVAGDAAWLVDPLVVPDIAAAMQTLLANPQLGAELGRRGRARAASFTWRRAAEQTLEVYRRAAAIAAS